MSMGTTEATGSRGALREAASPILASVTFVIELAVVPMLLVAIRGDLGLGVSEIAWVYNTYAIAVAGAVLLGGWLGDRSDPRVVFSTGVLLFAAGAAICAFAPTLSFLLIGRFVQGLGGGIFSPLVPVLLTAASRGRPGRILILWGSITGYVAASLPFLAAEALSTVGWRTIYGGVASLALVSLILSYALTSRPGRASANSTLRRVSSLSRAPLLWCYAYIAFTYGIVFFTLFDLPNRADSAFDAGLLLSFVWFSFALASTALRNIVDSDRVGWLIVLAPLMLGLGSVMLISHVDVLIFLGAPFMGIGFAMANAPSTQLVLRYAPKEARSLAASFDITVARLGGVIVVGGLASASATTVGAALITLAVAALISGALSLGSERVRA